MQVFNTLAEFRQVHSSCVATIGKYDGMHLGHQAILKKLLAKAKELGEPSLVILSEPQPEEFFAGDRAPSRLNLFWDKVDFLKGMGIDLVYRLTFDETTSCYSPERFIDEVLVQGLGIKSLVVGDDFRFGKDRRGDVALLNDYGSRAGFSVHGEPGTSRDGERISSTRVRECLRQGNLPRARQMLGRDYSIAGEVVRGRQLGRQLGIPTANVDVGPGSLPMTGIYAVAVEVRGQQFRGVASIGYKPTVTDKPEPSLEVYLFDFDGNIYSAWMRVYFLSKIREEGKFDSLDDLKQQMLLDIDEARNFFLESGVQIP